MVRWIMDVLLAQIPTDGDSIGKIVMKRATSEFNKFDNKKNRINYKKNRTMFLKFKYIMFLKAEGQKR